MQYLPKIANVENLRSAFRHISANHTGPGSDGVSIEQFGEGLEQNLVRIQEEIAQERYTFQPALAIDLHSQNRTVFLLAVQDRVVLQAIAQILRTPLEKCLHPANYSYCLGRSAVQATIALHKRLQTNQFAYILRCDVRHYFDEIAHDILCRFLVWALGDEADATMRLVQAALKQNCLLQGSLEMRQKGICQGSPLSPLLSNLYLTPLDRYLEKQGFDHFRFCDDIAILLPSCEIAQSLCDDIATFLEEHLRLRLHPDKLKLVSYQEGFEFLGFHISPQGRFPGKAAQERLQNRISDAETQEQKDQAITRWEAYFGQGIARKILDKTWHFFASKDQTQSESPDVQKAIPENSQSIPKDKPKDRETPIEYENPQAETDAYESTPRIISLFARLFRGNPNCFAIAYKTDDRYGYKPVKRHIHANDLLAHFLGKQTMGIYLLHQNKAACTCLDIDIARNVLEDSLRNPSQAIALRQTIWQHAYSICTLLRDIGLQPLLEDSGYKGYHLWLFFQDYVPASTVFQFWSMVLSQAGKPPSHIQREIFPRESKTYGGLGSLVKLPLSIHPGSGRRSMFVNDAGEPVSNPQRMLEDIRPISTSDWQTLLQNPGFAKKQNRQNEPDEVKKMLAGCHVVSHLCHKAIEQKHLCYFERYILLYTLGQLGDSGIKYLHYIIGHCKDYKYAITQKFIDKKHPSPMGCRRIQEIMGDALQEIPCNCPLNARKADTLRPCSMSTPMLPKT